MNDDELKRLWREQTLASAKVSPDDQIKLILKKAGWRDRVFRWCDAWLIGVEAWLMLFFAFAFLKTPASVARIGLVIIIASGVLIIWKTVRARHVSPLPAPDAPVTHWLQHELAKVNAQYELARTALWWYVLPPWIGMNVYVWGLGIGLPSGIGCSMVITMIFVVYWKLNQYTLRKHWPPLKEELESLLKSDIPE